MTLYDTYSKNYSVVKIDGSSIAHLSRKDEVSSFEAKCLCGMNIRQNLIVMDKPTFGIYYCSKCKKAVDE
jgi:hypothetical protein